MPGKKERHKKRRKKKGRNLRQRQRQGWTYAIKFVKHPTVVNLAHRVVELVTWQHFVIKDVRKLLGKHTNRSASQNLTERERNKREPK
mmetsp:Transcript_20774/g.36447  ORF Transcript_20774/g.36447 Transcript_20774/m.36447 type:complete len:88 (+) Transcript_20774:147-410(+)